MITLQRKSCGYHALRPTDRTARQVFWLPLPQSVDPATEQALTLGQYAPVLQARQPQELQQGVTNPAPVRSLVPLAFRSGRSFLMSKFANVPENIAPAVILLPMCKTDFYLEDALVGTFQ